MEAIRKILGAAIAMVILLIFIHLLIFCVALLASLIFWMDPIDTIISSYIKSWEPLKDGWSISNSIAFVLWFGLGLILSSMKIPEERNN